MNDQQDALREEIHSIAESYREQTKLNSMNERHLADGPHWSPHGDYFWAKGGKYYWPDGDITDSPPCVTWDSGSDKSHVEDYSAWTDKHRAKVKTEIAAQEAEIQRQAAEYVAKRDAIAKPIVDALTEEQIDAVREYLRED